MRNTSFGPNAPDEAVILPSQPHAPQTHILIFADASDEGFIDASCTAWGGNRSKTLLPPDPAVPKTAHQRFEIAVCDTAWGSIEAVHTIFDPPLKFSNAAVFFAASVQVPIGAVASHYMSRRAHPPHVVAYQSTLWMSARMPRNTDTPRTVAEWNRRILRDYSVSTEHLLLGKHRST